MVALKALVMMSLPLMMVLVSLVDVNAISTGVIAVTAKMKLTVDLLMMVVQMMVVMMVDQHVLKVL